MVPTCDCTLLAKGTGVVGAEVEKTSPVIVPTADFVTVSRATVNVPAPVLFVSPQVTFTWLDENVELPRIVGVVKFGELTNVSNSMFGTTPPTTFCGTFDPPLG